MPKLAGLATTTRLCGMECVARSPPAGPGSTLAAVCSKVRSMLRKVADIPVAKNRDRDGERGQPHVAAGRPPDIFGPAE